MVPLARDFEETTKGQERGGQVPTELSLVCSSPAQIDCFPGGKSHAVAIEDQLARSPRLTKVDPRKIGHRPKARSPDVGRNEETRRVLDVQSPALTRVILVK